MQWADKLISAGAFFSLFSAYLFNKGPSANTAQYSFRVGTLVLGLLLLIAGIVLKAKNKNRN
jgi:hypothetical protein